ncbi:hypothetical protein [Streptomyces ziwulingensis]|uniref:Uncharacterized protein n=1 Tax=Streptomyces ziwulingensis TaxID=1045501 RepID=A0ABP9C7J8_9ACTN
MWTTDDVIAAAPSAGLVTSHDEDKRRVAFLLGRSLAAEMDLFAQHFTVPLRAARNHQVLITDKTPANVLALAGLVLDPSEPDVASILGAAEMYSRAWMPHAYDAVVYCRDRYDQKAGGDRMREKVLAVQNPADDAIHEALRTVPRLPVLEMPLGLTVAERVRWTVARVDELGLTAVCISLESPTGKAPTAWRTKHSARTSRERRDAHPKARRRSRVSRRTAGHRLRRRKVELALRESRIR